MSQFTLAEQEHQNAAESAGSSSNCTEDHGTVSCRHFENKVQRNKSYFRRIMKFQCI
jgi:hypothetical protein